MRASTLTAIFGGLAVTTAMFFSQSAKASFMEQCNFAVEVKAVERLGILGKQVSFVGEKSDTYVHVMTVEVKSAGLADGARGCDRHEGESFQIVIKAKSTVKSGDQMNLIYTNANSFTPQGVASMLRWEVAP